MSGFLGFYNLRLGKSLGNFKRNLLSVLGKYL
nr:MAG TPA: hypothetical protein [Caudoviricetes sp.]